MNWSLSGWLQRLLLGEELSAKLTEVGLFRVIPTPGPSGHPLPRERAKRQTEIYMAMQKRRTANCPAFFIYSMTSIWNTVQMPCIRA